MEIELKRAYDPATDQDGFRILVERLWPRGVSKEKARIDLWAKALSPSPELRRWYSHDQERWPEFKRRYLAELADAAASEAIDEVLRHARAGKLTFVFGSKETKLNSANVLREHVLALG